MALNMDKKQVWDSVRFIIAVIFTAGVLYATVTAAVSDIADVKLDIKTRVDAADKTHGTFDLRLRELEQERARSEEWRKNTSEVLQRIERKIERSK